MYLQEIEGNNDAIDVHRTHTHTTRYQCVVDWQMSIPKSQQPTIKCTNDGIMLMQALIKHLYMNIYDCNRTYACVCVYVGIERFRI